MKNLIMLLASIVSISANASELATYDQKVSFAKEAIKVEMEKMAPGVTAIIDPASVVVHSSHSLRGALFNIVGFLAGLGTYDVNSIDLEYVTFSSQTMNGWVYLLSFDASAFQVSEDRPVVVNPEGRRVSMMLTNTAPQDILDLVTLSKSEINLHLTPR